MKLEILNHVFFIICVFTLATELVSGGYEDSNTSGIPPKSSASGILKPQAKIDRLLRVVSQNRAKSCLLRVICELGVDPECMAKDGQNFIDSIRDMEKIDSQKLEVYKEAHTLGQTFQDREVCLDNFECNLKSPQFVRMANLVLKGQFR